MGVVLRRIHTERVRELIVHVILCLMRHVRYAGYGPTHFPCGVGDGLVHTALDVVHEVSQSIGTAMVPGSHLHVARHEVVRYDEAVLT